MASYMLSVYAHIEEATSPLATLGLADDRAPSEADVSLFLKVPQAYESLQKKLDEGFVGEDGQKRIVRLLTEAPSALHARNLDFKQALKDLRAGALKAKRAEDQGKAAAEAKSARTQAERSGQSEVREATYGSKETKSARKQGLDKRKKTKQLRTALRNSTSSRSGSGYGHLKTSVKGAGNAAHRVESKKTANDL
ncbi:hypothetical protein LTR85_007140 [Meristemomyces frigidus]|nr:hypothetical protein LTR85_007140 [Meristemomyces frigidus]